MDGTDALCGGIIKEHGNAIGCRNADAKTPLAGQDDVFRIELLLLLGNGQLQEGIVNLHQLRAVRLVGKKQVAIGNAQKLAKAVALLGCMVSTLLFLPAFTILFSRIKRAVMKITRSRK